MALPRHTGRSRFGLFLLILASATLLSLDARDFGPVERLKDGIAAVMNPVRSVGDSLFGPVGDTWSDMGGNADLEAENERLRGQIAQLLDDRVENVGAAQELTELRSMLGLDGTGGFEIVVAEVTAGSVSNFDPYVLEIDKGTADGITDGMPVRVNEGMIGRVEDTRRSSARVRLITDPDVHIGVLVLGTTEIGIVRGTGQNEPLRVTDSIPVGANVRQGDTLVTSGLDRSPYPEGLVVGMVSAIEVDQVSLDQHLVVTPTAELTQLHFVAVILYEPDSEEAEGGSP